MKNIKTCTYLANKSHTKSYEKQAFSFSVQVIKHNHTLISIFLSMLGPMMSSHIHIEPFCEEGHRASALLGTPCVVQVLHTGVII